jgi:hypothetical protein
MSTRLLILALAMAATWLIAVAPAAAEETTVPLTEEQEAPIVYAALTYSQVTSPTAPEEHVNGSVDVLETALLDIFNEQTPVTESNAGELEELFAKVHIEPSREENIGTLLEDFVTIGRQIGAEGAEPLVLRKGGDAERARPALVKPTISALDKAYSILGDRIGEIGRELALPGLSPEQVEDYWKQYFTVSFAVRYFEQAERAGLRAVDFGIVDDAILHSVGTDASLHALIQRAIDTGYVATAKEAELLEGPVTAKQLQNAQINAVSNISQVDAPAANQVFQDNPPLPAGHAEDQGLAGSVADDESEVVEIDSVPEIEAVEDADDIWIWPHVPSLPAVPANIPAAAAATRDASSAVAKGADIAIDAGLDVGETAAGFADPLLAVQALSQAPQLISQITNLISGTPSSEQIVLEQINALREMIGNLSKQVQTELASVDASLASINATLEEDTLLLQNINTHVGKIETAMAHLEERINALQADLLEIAKTQREEGLVTDLDTDIGYSERSPGHTPLPLVQFEQAAGAFFAWGTFDPFDALSELPSSQWAGEPAAIASQLGSATSTDSLDFNLDYLASFVDEHGWGDGLTISPGLPNPAVWADGANAFAQLLSENEEYVTPSLLSELGSLREIGASLPVELEKISKPGAKYKELTVGTATIATGSSVLNHAIANYLEQGESFLKRLVGQENSFLSLQDPGKEGESNCVPCRLGSAPNSLEPGSTGSTYLDPWGGVEQAQSPSIAPLEEDSEGNDSEEAGHPVRGQLNWCDDYEQSTDEDSAFGIAVPNNDSLVGPGEGAGELALEPTIEVAGHKQANPLLAPVPNLYATAWHLGLGHVYLCYQPYLLKAYLPEGPAIGDMIMLTWFWHDNAGGNNAILKTIRMIEPLHQESEDTCEVGRPNQRLQNFWSTVPSSCKEKFAAKPYEQVLADFLAATKESQPANGYVELDNCKAAPEYGAAASELAGWQGCVMEGGAKDAGLLDEIEGCKSVYEGKTLCAYEEVLPEAEAALETLRQDIYEEIAPSEQPSLNASGEDPRQAANALDGARALLDDYIQLGAPVSLAGDPALGKLVYGPQHLLDDSPGAYELFSYFNGEAQRAERQAEEKHQPLPANPFASGGALEARMDSGAQALAGQLKSDLSEMTGAAQIEQGDELVGATDARLEIGQIAFRNGEAPVITKQPAAASVVEGATATFTAEASGKPLPEAQWEVSTNGGTSWSADKADAGNTTDTLHVEHTSAGESGNEYRARFENPAGATTTLSASLAVKAYQPPTVTTPKEASTVTVTEPATAKLTAEASGTPQPSVQWEVSTNGGTTWNADITDGGEATDTLTIEDTSFLENGYEYRARFENQAGSGEARSALSPIFTLDVIERLKPLITKQPVALTVLEPAPATFTAEASGIPAPTVQWEVSTNAGVNWSADTTDAGNTTDTLKIEKTSASLSGHEYRATFTNSAGSIPTEAATLTVEKPPAPAFTIEAAQEVKGSGTGFTEKEITVALDKTIDYRITVVNTGNEPLRFSNFSDANCTNLAGGPGTTEVKPTESTRYTCERSVSKDGTYVDEASVEGTPPLGDGFAAMRSSNQLIAVGPSPSPTVLSEAATAVEQRSAVLNATVDPHGGKVTSCKFEYGSSSLNLDVSCSSLPGSSSTGVPVSAVVKGLTPNSSYRFRITAASASGSAKGAEVTFHTTEALAPSAETAPASEVGQRTATVNATVDPNGSEVTACTFEYGTSTLSASASCSTLPGSGTSPVVVSSKLKGLAPGSSYRFRISATTLSGTSKGAIGSFVTDGAFAPSVETGTASEVTKNAALLNATVNPNGAEVTSCRFEYGTKSSSLSSSVACSKLPGSGAAAVAVSAPVKGLAINTYYFRISATSASGTSKGAESSFKT